MAAQKGLELLIKKGDGASPEVFTTIGGFQSTSFNINNTQVDVTSQDDTNRWRQLLAGAGVKSVSAAGNGPFVDDAAIGSIVTEAMNDTHSNYQVVVPDLGTFAGPFQIAGLGFAGEHDAEVTDDVSLESAGTIAFTAA